MPAANSAPLEPAVASASGPGWRRLGQLGLALALGFAAGLLALALFALLAEDVLGEQTAQLDRAVLAGLRQFSSPGLDLLAQGVSVLGSEAVGVFLLVLLALFAAQRRWGAGVALLLTTGGAQLLNSALKELFHRARPLPLAGTIGPQQFSFPSGHAMVSAAFYFFLAYLCWRVVRGAARRAALVGGLLLLVLLIGLSRLYLGVHFLSDVVAGSIGGFVWTDAVILAGHLLARPAGGRLAPRAPRSQRVCCHRELLHPSPRGASRTTPPAGAADP